MEFSSFHISGHITQVKNPNCTRSITKIEFFKTVLPSYNIVHPYLGRILICFVYPHLTSPHHVHETRVWTPDGLQTLKKKIWSFNHSGEASVGQSRPSNLVTDIPHKISRKWETADMTLDVDLSITLLDKPGFGHLSFPPLISFPEALIKFVVKNEKAYKRWVKDIEVLESLPFPSAPTQSEIETDGASLAPSSFSGFIDEGTNSSSPSLIKQLFKLHKK